MKEFLKYLDQQPKRPILKEEVVFSNFWGYSDSDKERIVKFMDELRAIHDSQAEADVLGTEEYRLILSETAQKGGDTPIGERELKKKKFRSKQEFKDRGLDKAEEMLVVFNDIQFTQTDGEALGAGLKFIKANRKQITHFVLNGDILDMEATSKFPKEPDELDHTSEELDQAQWFLSTIKDLLPDAKKVFVFGNHEDRYKNFLKNQTNGIEEFLISLEDKLGLKEDGWEVVDYGRGKFWKWHDRIFWHGSRAGAKSNIPKLELEDTGGVSVTTGHINRNMYHESVDVLGKYKSGIAHGGFSKDDLRFVRKANSGWTQGFGVYYWDKRHGEQPYMVLMEHKNPTFIWNGEIFDGTNFQIGDKV